MATLAQYIAFHTLINTGNFTATGLKLNLTQSSISHAISNLEAELNLALIIRNRNNIVLTNEGKVVYEHISKILKQQQHLESAVADLKNLIGGSLSVGILPSVSLVLLPKVLAYFEEHHPNLNIRLMEGDYDQIEEWLHNGVVDIGFLVEPHSKHLLFNHVFNDELVCIMAKQHPLANAKKLHLEQLKNERWIMPKRTIDRDVSRILTENKIHPNIVYDFSVDQVILSMVNENLGISIVPKSLLIHAPHHLIRKKFYESYVRKVGIAHNRSIHLSPGALEFLEICKKFASNLESNY
ncbi:MULTISPECIES: LysR family transcriptional regulator [Bacillus]|uniref:HTH-type transcriptional regulator CzcR n=2 Tax=Bacillus cereus group TaxID=86661 RepID=A0A164PY81_BACCE|nr:MULTISPECIES: LysR family transcriptional regulator [Bacillus]KZD69127.1 LysR family transcriptional regulator [Bacillus cereus]TSI15799.1 LysR family transcriptional regulator [Bacillus sp. HY001]SME14032.1 HTH-type transcriptional activator CmpR [Bacillus mobilis]